MSSSRFIKIESLIKTFIQQNIPIINGITENHTHHLRKKNKFYTYSSQIENKKKYFIYQTVIYQRGRITKAAIQ